MLMGVLKGCGGKTRRRRYRTVVRHPAAAGSGDASVVAADDGARPDCPHLEEFERCDGTIVDCRTFSWRWTAWSTCLLADSMPAASDERLSGAVTPYGAGRRFRYVECVRSDGQVVAEQFCRQHLPVCIHLFTSASETRKSQNSQECKNTRRHLFCAS